MEILTRVASLSELDGVNHIPATAGFFSSASSTATSERTIEALRV